MPSLVQIGLDSWEGSDIELITSKPESAVYRLSSGHNSAVLKMSLDGNGFELAAYRLLQNYQVPTLQVYASGADWILLEDLQTSRDWRLATVDDADSEETGAALADWFKALHAATGAAQLLESIAPSVLMRQCDALTRESLQVTGERLGISGLPVWHLAVSSVEQLKAGFLSYPETLNYNDFHWTNLALSRNDRLDAVVFDYHLLGIGPVWCDRRNVCGSLGPTAREAFIAAYGEVDDSVAVFDQPLSVLYSLGVASRLERVPGWAHACLECVRNGELESLLIEALGSSG